jgi:hypothetical protein
MGRCAHSIYPCLSYSDLWSLVGSGSALITLWDFYTMDLRDVLGLQQGPEGGELLPEATTTCLRYGHTRHILASSCMMLHILSSSSPI